MITPGKWKYGVRKDKSMWLSLGDPMVGPHYQGDLVASQDDAKLIIAAPDLLAALKDVKSYLAWDHDSTSSRLLDIMNNAIDKAEAK